MLLEVLKESYKKTFTEPRLSGRYLPEDYQKEFFDKIDSATTLDELVTAIGHSGGEKHILSRIIAWENEPPIESKS